MKHSCLIKLTFASFAALAAGLAYADVVMEPCPAILHRIGYEVFVYVSGAVAGSALVRYIARKNWRINNNKQWKDEYELREHEAAEIAEKIHKLRQSLHAAVRKVYDKIDGFLEQGWECDLVLSALEGDEALMERCKGIPIECLIAEAEKAVKDEIESRMAAVLPDFRRTFDAAYEVKMREWLKADSKMMSYVKFRNSLLNRIRRLCSSSYRHKVDIISAKYFKNLSWAKSNPVPLQWHILCFSLAEALLERTEGLKPRCRGVERHRIIEAVCGKDCPRDFHGLISDADYLREINYEDSGKPLTGESRTVIRDKVDIEKVLKNLREPAVFGGDFATFKEYEESKTRDTASELERRPRLVQSATEVKSAFGRWRMAVREGGGDEPRNVTYLPDHAILVGRSRSAEFRITCPDVSGRHCELIMTQEGASLRVLSRIGATMVDGERYSEGKLVRLYIGDRISLGNTARIEILEVPMAAIGGFRILEEIHSGGQGKLFKAVCETPPFDGIETGMVVALKVMPVVHDEGGRRWTRLQERTDTLVKLSHPNVVKYYGCFREKSAVSEIYVVVMECLEGETLKDRLVRNPDGLDVDEALRIAKLAIEGLVCTSEAGIIHRDVKPGSIFLCKDGGAKLIDFEESYVIDGSTVTDTAGNICGTFDYMAPEWTNSEFYGDVKSDVFSMGVVLHEILCGKKPYKPLGATDSRQSHLAFLDRWAHPPSSEEESPIQVDPVIRRIIAHAEEVFEKALAPNRDYRYPDFASFLSGTGKVLFRCCRNGALAYKLLQYIGKSGSGEVFKARSVSTGRVVAVRHMLRPGEKFAVFAQIIQSLHDPTIVRVYESFTMSSGYGDHKLVVMEYLTGNPDRSLRDAIQRALKSESGHLPMINVLQAFKCYAHGLQILHEKFGCQNQNNIRPSALYYNAVKPDGSAIMDFNWPQADYATFSATFSHDWCIRSQLPYIAPEAVVTGCRGNASMDIYALGLSLYEALTGKTAYPPLPPGMDAFRVLCERAKKHVSPTFDSPVVTERPALLSLVKDMTNIDPENRIRDAAEVERRIMELVFWM